MRGRCQRLTSPSATTSSFVRMCPALGLPELTTDARFTTNAPRIEHRTGLAGELGLSADELDRLQREGAIVVG